MGILDAIFPKYCVSCKKIGSHLCSTCFATIRFTEGEICAHCNRASFNGLTHIQCQTKNGIDGIFTGVEYKGIMRKLIYQFKYKPFVSSLSLAISELFYENLIQKEVFMTILNKSTPLFTSIPLYPSKERTRGYNHAAILAQRLSKQFAIPQKSLLKRVKNTTSQFKLKRDERLENMKGAFELTTPIEHYSNLTIFLVDDIVTTGSTFLEAAKTLKKQGIKEVYGLAFARD